MSKKRIGFDEISALLEEQIRCARFRVQVSDENLEYAYVVDEPPYPAQQWTVLSCALPLADARRRVKELRARPFRYLWMKTGADAYLGFGAAVIHRPTCGRYALVMIPEEHAQWQIGRLRSGMQAVGEVYETAAEALVQLAEARALGVW